MAENPARDRIARSCPANRSVMWRDQVPPPTRGAPSQPEEEKITLRTSIVVLILVNILLGIASLAPSASRAPIVDVPVRCCRGEGPDAYCCRMCCVRGPHCERDSDCRGAD